MLARPSELSVFRWREIIYTSTTNGRDYVLCSHGTKAQGTGVHEVLRCLLQ